jgi:hypothetical protein
VALCAIGLGDVCQRRRCYPAPTWYKQSPPWGPLVNSSPKKWLVMMAIWMGWATVQASAQERHVIATRVDLP